MEKGQWKMENGRMGIPFAIYAACTFLGFDPRHSERTREESGPCAEVRSFRQTTPEGKNPFTHWPDSS
jgi:hypothetical protein